MEQRGLAERQRCHWGSLQAKEGFWAKESLIFKHYLPALGQGAASSQGWVSLHTSLTALHFRTQGTRPMTHLNLAT